MLTHYRASTFAPLACQTEDRNILWTPDQAHVTCPDCRAGLAGWVRRSVVRADAPVVVNDPRPSCNGQGSTYYAHASHCPSRPADCVSANGRHRAWAIRRDARRALGVVGSHD